MFKPEKVEGWKMRTVETRMALDPAQAIIGVLIFLGGWGGGGGCARYTVTNNSSFTDCGFIKLSDSSAGQNSALH